MVLPILLRNAGTVPVCALEAAIRQGGRRRRAGQAFEWFTVEPLVIPLPPVTPDLLEYYEIYHGCTYQVEPHQLFDD